MKINDEIKFWQQAKRIIRADYGPPCKEFTFSCGGCQANLVVSWIDEHIDLLKYRERR